MLHMLPRVNEQIAFSLKHEMLDQGEQYLPNLIERIRSENPAVIRFIEGFCNNYDPSHHRYVIACALGIYRLLEVQVEVDELNETLK